MFQAFFKDDELTALDGAYVRLIRSRKWLLLSAAIGFLVEQGHYKPAEAQVLVKVFALPTDLVWWATFSSLSYILVQYGAVGLQLRSVYDLVLFERLEGRRKDLLAVRWTAFVQALKAFLANRNLENGRYAYEIDFGAGGISDQELKDLGPTIEEQNSVEAARNWRAVEETRASWRSAERQDPASRPDFGKWERRLDLFRIAPIFLVGSSVWISMAWSRISCF